MALADRVRWLIDTFHEGSVNAAATANGIPQRTLAYLASGEVANPRARVLQQLAAFYQTSVDWLLSGAGEPPALSGERDTGELLSWRRVVERFLDNARGSPLASVPEPAYPELTPAEREWLVREWLWTYGDIDLIVAQLLGPNPSNRSPEIRRQVDSIARSRTVLFEALAREVGAPLLYGKIAYMLPTLERFVVSSMSGGSPKERARNARSEIRSTNRRAEREQRVERQLREAVGNLVTLKFVAGETITARVLEVGDDRRPGVRFQVNATVKRKSEFDIGETYVRPIWHVWSAEVIDLPSVAAHHQKVHAPPRGRRRKAR